MLYKMMSYKNHYVVCTWACSSLQFKHCDHMISFWSPPVQELRKIEPIISTVWLMVFAIIYFTILKTELVHCFLFLVLCWNVSPDLMVDDRTQLATCITIVMTYSFIHAINFLHSVEMSWEYLSDTLWATALISVNSSSRLKHSANT